MSRVSKSIERWFGSNLLVSRHRDVRLFAALCVAVATMFLAYISRMHDVTHDAFHEMALAREWIMTGVFPTDDLFAYTPTVSPTVHHEWGTGVVLYWVAALSPLGLDGMVLFKLILTTILGATLYRVARGNGAHPIVFFLLLPIVFPVLWVGFATLRAQLFTLVGLALTMLMLQADWRGKRGWVFFWIPMYLIWLNLHAGFVVGLGLLGFHFIERLAAILSTEVANRNSTLDSKSPRGIVLLRVLTSKRLYQQIVACHWHLFALGPVIVVGIAVNPWGWQYVSYLLHAITMPRPTILEWKPIWFTYDPVTTILTLGCSILLIAYAAKERRWARLRGWAFCALAAYMAMKHIRHGSLYGVVWIALVPAWITPTPFGKLMIRIVKETRTSWIRLACIPVVLSIAFALYQPFYRVTLPTNVAPSSLSYPKGVVDYLEAHSVHGNVMTPFHCGAYVSWRLYPAVKVSLDGRYEVAYQPQVMEQHARFYEALDGWNEVLSQYDHDFLIVPKDAAIYLILLQAETSVTQKWNCIYEDNSFALFGNAPPPKPVKSTLD